MARQQHIETPHASGRHLSKADLGAAGAKVEKVRTIDVGPP